MTRTVKIKSAMSEHFKPFFFQDSRNFQYLYLHWWLPLFFFFLFFFYNQVLHVSHSNLLYEGALPYYTHVKIIAPKSLSQTLWKATSAWTLHCSRSTPSSIHLPPFISNIILFLSLSVMMVCLRYAVIKGTAIIWKYPVRAEMLHVPHNHHVQ